MADLGALIRDLEPAAVLPLDDHAVWLTDQYDRHASVGLATTSTVIAGPTGKLAELALDKRQQLELAATAGFAVPPSADAATGRPPGDGPWIVKPALAVQLAGGTLRRPSGRIAHAAPSPRDRGGHRRPRPSSSR